MVGVQDQGLPVANQLDPLPFGLQSQIGDHRQRFVPQRLSPIRPIDDVMRLTAAPLW